MPALTQLKGCSIIQGKLIALKACVQLLKNIVHSVIQLSHIQCLVTETGVMSKDQDAGVQGVMAPPNSQ